MMRGVRRSAARIRLETDERRRQLVDLGLSYFGGRAYDDVSIDDIASAAGISKGLLYHYFPNKRAFYVACVEEATERVLAACTQMAGEKSAPPLERLDRGITAYLDYVHEHGRAYAGLMRSGVGVDPKVAVIVDRARERFVAHLLEGIAEAVPLTPRTKIALRGWVGFAEAATLAWVEGIESAAVKSGTRAQMTRETTREITRRITRPVTRDEMRDLLKNALLAIVVPAR